MKADEDESSGNRILIVKLSLDDLVNTHTPRGAWPFFQALDKLILSHLNLGNLTRRLTSPPLVVIDLSDANFDAEISGKWVLFMKLTKAHFLSYVEDRSGKVVFYGLVASPDCGHVSIAPTLESAFNDLAQHQADVRTDSNFSPSDALTQRISSRICLIGCPDKDVGDLPEDFNAFGIDVGTASTITNNDYAIFCLNTGVGISDGTRSAINSCRSRTIIPLAIVLTNYGCLNDDSLRTLITLEEQELISSVLPGVSGESLPVFQDVDPALVTKLLELVVER